MDNEKWLARHGFRKVNGWLWTLDDFKPELEVILVCCYDKWQFMVNDCKWAKIEMIGSEYDTAIEAVQNGLKSLNKKLEDFLKTME